MSSFNLFIMLINQPLNEVNECKIRNAECGKGNGCMSDFHFSAFRIPTSAFLGARHLKPASA